MGEMPATEARFVEKNGKTRKGEWRCCLACSKWFAGRAYMAVPQKYCSDACARPHIKALSIITLTCSLCQTSFTRSKAKHENRTVKTAYAFCGRKCKERAQRLDSTLHEIKPPHYGKRALTYRELAYKTYGIKCADCNISAEGFLQVHHKDGNHSNNDKDNLEVLCFNHHAVRHMKQLKNGSWVHCSKSLTPRALILDITKKLGL